jgi:hypothetical protein
LAVYVCPSCGATVTPVEGSLTPRPCPNCLETTGRVVEMMPEASPDDARLAEEA